MAMEFENNSLEPFLYSGITLPDFQREKEEKWHSLWDLLNNKNNGLSIVCETVNRFYFASLNR